MLDTEQDRGSKRGCLSTIIRKQPWLNNHHSALTLLLLMSHHAKYITKVLSRRKATGCPSTQRSHNFHALVQCQFWLLQLMFMVSVLSATWNQTHAPTYQRRASAGGMQKGCDSAPPSAFAFRPPTSRNSPKQETWLLSISRFGAKGKASSTKVVQFLALR